MPLFTVIMPAYNASATIGRAVRSVRSQTWRDWELRVIDDGSSDDTAQTALAAAEEDRRVRIERLPENVGAAAAMNHAWRSADSPFIAILDADDVALPARLAHQLDHLQAHREIDVLGGGAHFVDANRRFLRTVKMPAEHEALARRRWYACPFVHPTVVMRRAVLETLGGYTAGLRLGEDYDLWMRGFQAGTFRYANIAEPLVIYTAKPVQQWTMIKASARVRMIAGRRQQRTLRGAFAAARILGEGLVEQTGVFAWRDERRPRIAPPGLGELGIV